MIGYRKDSIVTTKSKGKRIIQTINSQLMDINEKVIPPNPNNRIKGNSLTCIISLPFSIHLFFILPLSHRL